jgi:hypothetical protein
MHAITDAVAVIISKRLLRLQIYVGMCVVHAFVFIFCLELSYCLYGCFHISKFT